MKPIERPTVVGAIENNSERISGLQRQTFPRPVTANHRASVSFIGKQPTDSSSPSFNVVSAPHFASKEFIPDQIWVDLDSPIGSAVLMKLMSGDDEIFRFAIVPNTPFCLTKIDRKVLVQPTRSLRVEGVNEYPASLGFVTIQVIGVSSVPFSQTVGLRFVEPE